MPIDHVSVPTAAKILGKSAKTLRRWIRAGQLPVLRFPGKQPRVTRETIQKLLTEDKGVPLVDTHANRRIH